MTSGVAARPNPRFPRGSEWRRWDLQVHTPYSALNNGFGNDFDAYAKRLIELAVELDIAAVGITDYFSVEGYRQIRGLITDAPRLTALVGEVTAERARAILFLPNVELRAAVFVRDSSGNDSRVNFHVIFSDELTPDEIDEHFLRDLRFTAESAPNEPDERLPITSENLEALGRRLKSQHAPFSDRSDLVIGMTNAVIDHEQVTEVLAHQPSRFEGRYLVVVPADEDLSAIPWDGQGHLGRKIFVQKAHMLFSSNQGTREFGLGRRHASPEAFKAEFKSLKPCIHGSDAHDFGTLFVPAQQRYTWIKADPTFRGLQQLRYEPDTRVFIGVLPPGLAQAETRPTRIVDRVKVNKVASSPLAESWFDLDLELNPGLIVVIGNKGSGKSALADIVALIGNTKRHEAFSFLSAARFRRPRDGKADQFEGRLTWADGTSDGPINLASDPDITALERVRYIPQNYLEEICNEIGMGRKGRFYAELQQVIFSHVPPAERLGFNTLDDLLGHLGEGIQHTIRLLQGELREINQLLAQEMTRSLPQEAQGLTELVAEKRRELAAHETNKPETVPTPEEDPSLQELGREVSADLAARQEELGAASQRLGELGREVASLVRRQATANRLLTKLENLRRQVSNALQDASDDLSELGLSAAAIAELRIDDAPIRTLIASTGERLAEIRQLTDEAVEGSVAAQRASLAEQVQSLEATLTAPQQAYQKYRRDLAAWDEARQQIVGTPESAGTILFLEARLDDLKNLPERIRWLERKRDRKALEIYAEKHRLRKHYDAYYRPVQEFLEEHPLAGELFQLTFQTSIQEADFRERFLRMVNHSRLGPFFGVQEGAGELEQILGGVNWNSACGALRVARSVLSRMRKHNEREMNLGEQLVQDVSVEGLLDFLFSFDFLEPIYELKWDGKGVDALSPGERGNLLLIFYLLIDRENIPLVIDQPEENLDNQTVVQTLVPCVKDAKQRRQIIMVTHNPNLAVVCDADQVVYAEMHKESANDVTYESGSIEDPAINQRILDVLEGTRPAFRQRDARYLDN